MRKKKKRRQLSEDKRDLEKDRQIRDELFRLFEAKDCSDLFVNGGGKVDLDEMLAEALRSWSYWLEEVEELIWGLRKSGELISGCERCRGLVCAMQ